MQNPNQSPFNPPPLSPPSNPLPLGVTPQMSPAEERNWAVATHLASFSGYFAVPCGHILGPLIIWLMKKDSSNFLDEIGKETVNYNISILIWFAVCIPFCFLLIGIPFLIGLAIMDIIVTIMAAVAASNGQQYKYPLTIRFIS